jgi:hypothetical protein
MANKPVKLADLARLKYNISREKALILEGVNALRWRNLDQQTKDLLVQDMLVMVKGIHEHGSKNEPDFVVDNWTRIVDLAKYGIFL